jgi:hypothetical protein
MLFCSTIRKARLAITHGSRLEWSLLAAVFAACLIAVSAQPIFAQPQPPAWQGVYQGSIGKAQVVVALTPDDARYFYVGQSNDLGLIVSPEGDHLGIVETLAPAIQADDVKDKPDLVSGAWSVTFADGAIKGFWMDAHGERARPIALTRVSSGDESADFVFHENALGAYGERWLRTAPGLVSDGVEKTIGPLSYRLMRDPQFGNSVPRLVKAPKSVNVEAVNAALDRLQRYLRLADRDCLQGVREMYARDGAKSLAKADKENADTRNDSPAALTPIFATGRLLTLEQTQMAFCGGAHPNLIDEDYVFDLADGAQLSGLDNDDGNGKSGDTGNVDPSWLGRALDLADREKRTKFDALWMGSIRAGIAAPHADDEPDCGEAIKQMLDQSDPDNPVSIIAYPVEAGLAIRVTGFPHAIQICGNGQSFNPTVIPYAALKPFLKPRQTLLPEGSPPPK